MSEEPCIAVENIQGSARIRPTGDFSVDPVGLERKALNDQFRLMRMSHESLQRSRGQLKRRTRELKEAQEVLVSTAARKLIPGATLNNSWLKDTIISMVTVTEKPASHSSDVAIERMALGQASAFVPSTSYPTRAVAVVASARHVI